VTLGRLLMHAGWTLLCPGAGQAAAGRRRVAVLWAAAGLASTVAITWTFWAIPAALAVRVASALDAAPRLRRATAEDRNAPLYASLVAVAGFVFFQFTTDRFAIPSDSMTPAIAVGDSVLVSTLAKTPRRGDVIVFAHPCDGITHIKRVAAVAGDTIEVRCGALYVNGVTHEPVGDGAKDFPRLDGVITGCAGRPPAGKVVHAAPGSSACAPQAHFVVPADSVFVLGDHRAVSIDSRAWGVVPVENVKGRALGVVWPLANAGAL
jgi:signal peptidase I